MWCVCTMEYYSAIKENEVLVHAYHMDEPWKYSAK